MISVSFREFVTTGAFGPLRLGMNRADVCGLLGEPEMWGTEKHKDVATIWRYADIEFYFTNHKLRMIFTDHGSLVDAGSTCMVDPWIIRRGLDRVELEAAFPREGIDYRSYTSDSDRGVVKVVTSSLIEFSFDEEFDPKLPDAALGLFTWNLQVR